MNKDTTHRTIHALHSTLDTDVSQVVELMLIHNVILTGVGKSFCVAQLGASSLRAVGISAQAIHATDLIHGCLNATMHRSTVLIAISHSGNTDELVDVITHATALRLLTVCVVGNTKSFVGGMCDIVLPYTADEDGSVHGTIPSVSTICQIAILNEITCGIANIMSRNELAKGHPGGSLYSKEQ